MRLCVRALGYHIASTSQNLLWIGHFGTSSMEPKANIIFFQTTNLKRQLQNYICFVLASLCYTTLKTTSFVLSLQERLQTKDPLLLEPTSPCKHFSLSASIHQRTDHQHLLCNQHAGPSRLLDFGCLNSRIQWNLPKLSAFKAQTHVSID